MENEFWKDIEGFEGVYQISNMGRVKRFNKTKYCRPFKILKNIINNTGYYSVCLSKHGSYKPYNIHRLISEAFIPRIEGSNVVNHIDGNKLNNSIENLEWTTPAGNIKHAYDTGLMTIPKGKTHYRYYVTEAKIELILSLYIPKIFTVKNVAEKLNMSCNAVKYALEKSKL